MPAKTLFTTREAVIHAPLPNHGGTYTVIPHEYVINTAKEQLSKSGFSIKHELYKTTSSGEIAQGIYHLDHKQDPEMGMMFAWSNSYNKKVRFKCAIGAHVFVCMNGVISGNMGNYARKHTGTADQEAHDMIEQQIYRASEYFNQLVADKDLLKEKLLTKKVKAELIGRLFMEEEVITLTQLGIIQREMANPSFLYETDPDSAWSLYNHVTHALKESHPKQYLDDHQKLHNMFVDYFSGSNTNIIVPAVAAPKKSVIVEPAEARAYVGTSGRVVFA